MTSEDELKRAVEIEMRKTIIKLAGHIVSETEKKLEVAVRALTNIRVADPSPDISHQKYVDAIRFINSQCDKALLAIQGKQVGE